MAIHSRTVKNKRDSNGLLTGKSGTVYDVNIKYNSPDGRKTYAKRGFLTKKEATTHESEMRIKLLNPANTPINAAQSKQTVKEYLDVWVENHGKANLRPSSFANYKAKIKNHIVPYIGHVQLKHLTPAMIDNMFQKHFEKGLSQSTVRYTQRILSVSMEAARKYRYIEYNPARDIITKFGKDGKTPDPYTIEQVREFLGKVSGTEWEMPVILGGLYGLRISEIIGLRWQNVDLKKMQFKVIEQMPFKLPAGTKIIDKLSPTKSNDRILPITEVTLPYFLKQFKNQERQISFIRSAGGEYYDNGLVIAKPDGTPFRREKVSSDFGHLIRKLKLNHIRFHDLRHSAASNMHQLTGDFFTVGEVLGHTLKGIGLSLGISSNLETETARYVDVRLDRKREVLGIYHEAVHKINDGKENKTNTTQKKTNDVDL